jgi:hypothetical protein
MLRGPGLSLTKVIIGVLALLLLVLSTGTLLVTYRASAMADQPGIQSPMSNRQISSSGHNSITPPIVTDTSLPSPTITLTITPSPTNTPTPTPTNTPTPTPTRTPSPTPTNTPSPKPTNTPSSSPVATATSLPHSTTTPGAHATPGANASASPGSDQSGGQGSTPTDSSTGTNTSVNDNGQGTSPNGQGRSFPFLELFGGVLCSITFLFLLFIGWQQLRRYLMPVAPVKLPPSGAPPWSRERPNNPWKPMNNNQGFPPSGPAVASAYGPATSPITPYPYQGAPVAGNFAPSNGNFPPVTDGFPALPHASDPERAIPFNAAPYMVPMNNNNGALPPAPPVTNGQWNGSPTNAGPDINDPYLVEMIREYREKGNAPGQPIG